MSRIASPAVIAVVAASIACGCGGATIPAHTRSTDSTDSVPARDAPSTSAGDDTATRAGRLRALFPPPGAVTDDRAPPVADVASAIDALAGRHGDVVAAVLVEALFALPGERERIRIALASIGADVIPELRRALRGENAAVNDRIPARVPPSTAREDVAALVLGDLRATDAIPDLVAALAGSARGTPHVAVLAALGKLGGTEAADAVRSIWTDPRSPDRRLALEVYATIAPDATAVPALWRIVEDPAVRDPALRDQALDTIGRVADSDRDVAKLRRLQRAAKARWRTAFRRAETSPERGELDDAAAEVERSTMSRGSSAAAWARHERASRELQPIEDAERAAFERLRFLDRQIARVELARRCRQRVPCLLAALTSSQEDVVDPLNLIADAERGGELDHTDARALAIAQLDRAMIDLAQLGRLPHAHRSGALDAVPAALLAALRCKPDFTCFSDANEARLAILRALATAPPHPCPECVRELDARILEWARDPALAALVLDATLLRHYLAR